MTNPVFSPDGKFMWTGNEWIPAPPQAENPLHSTSANQSKFSTNVNVRDGVIGGDVNITQNDTDQIMIALQLSEHDKWANEHFWKTVGNKSEERKNAHKEWTQSRRNLIVNPNFFGDSELCLSCQSALPNAKFYSENKQYTDIFSFFINSNIFCTWCCNILTETSLDLIKYQFRDKSPHAAYNEFISKGKDWKKYIFDNLDRATNTFGAMEAYRKWLDERRLPDTTENERTYFESVYQKWLNKNRLPDTPENSRHWEDNFMMIPPSKYL
jgi:hypothetical protein